MSDFLTHSELLLIFTHSIHFWSTEEKDTISYSASLDVSMLREVQLDELAKAAGVVVINCLGISKGLQDGISLEQLSLQFSLERNQKLIK